MTCLHPSQGVGTYEYHIFILFYSPPPIPYQIPIPILIIIVTIYMFHTFTTYYNIHIHGGYLVDVILKRRWSLFAPVVWDGYWRLPGSRACYSWKNLSAAGVFSFSLQDIRTSKKHDMCPNLAELIIHKEMRLWWSCEQMPFSTCFCHLGLFFFPLHFTSPNLICIRLLSYQLSRLRADVHYNWNSCSL